MPLTFEINIFTSTVFALLVLAFFYVVACAYEKKIVVPYIPKLFYYITIFSLFGVVGEVFVNTSYEFLLGTPLWEYRLFPAHGGSITYFFVLVWGLLGFYSYFRDTVFLKKWSIVPWFSAMVLGAEAILIELFYNGLYYLVFNDYIFYYFPANLGPFSHISCLQVIPFYMTVGLFTSVLIRKHNQLNYTRGSYIIVAFYWFIVITFVFL